VISPFAILYKSLRAAAFAVFLLLSFSVLEFFPGMAMLKEGWIVVIFITFITIYIGDRVAKGLRTTQFAGYILLLMAWSPISSAIQSRSESCQPLVYGFLAQRNNIFGADQRGYLRAYLVVTDTRNTCQNSARKWAWSQLPTTADGH